MKDKFPNLKWVVVMRHAQDHSNIPLPESKIFIEERLAPAMRERLSTKGDGKSVIVTSLNLRSVMTGQYLSRHLGMLNTFGVRQLGCDEYRDGEKLTGYVYDCLPQSVEVVIILGHYKTVPGMANAIVSSFGQTIECYEPKYLDGVVINMETGEHHVGINEFFGVN